MTPWSDRVEDLLFDGETIEAEVAVGASDVVVTSHRVLAFTPELDGKDFRKIDRPNVRAVRRQAVDAIDVRRRAAKLGVGGVVLAGVGLVFDPRSVIPRPELSSAEGAGEVGGILSLVRGMLELFYAVDVGLLVLGLLLLTLALGLLAIQLAMRSRRLAIDVAGEEPVLLSGTIDDPALQRLRDAVSAPPSTETDRSPTGGDASERRDTPGDREGRTAADGSGERRESRDRHADGDR